MPLVSEEISSGANATSAFSAAILATVATSTAAVSSTAAPRIIVPAASSANIADTIEMHEITPLTSAAVVTSTLAAVNNTVSALESSAEVVAAVQFGRTLPLASGAVVADTLALRHFAIVGDSIAVAATASAVLTNSATSTANITATLAPFSFPLSLSSGAVVADALGPFTVTAPVASGAVVESAATVLARVIRELESSAAISSALLAKLTATEALTSVGYVESFVRLPASAIESFWSNTRTTGAARWSSLKVNSIVEKDGALYAAGVDGVVELTEAGTHVGEVVWDLLDFGNPQLKTVDSMYLNGTAGGAMTVRAATDEGGWEYTTHLTSATTKSVNHRATLGRGLKATQYRFTVKAGHAFDIGSVHLQIADAKRRIGG